MKSDVSFGLPMFSSLWPFSELLRVTMPSLEYIICHTAFYVEQYPTFYDTYLPLIEICK